MFSATFYPYASIFSHLLLPIFLYFLSPSTHNSSIFSHLLPIFFYCLPPSTHIPLFSPTFNPHFHIFSHLLPMFLYFLLPSTHIPLFFPFFYPHFHVYSHIYLPLFSTLIHFVVFSFHVCF
uniref:Uncharacterized protein n=1 Tax=Cacopsylla melanoneura TaxID=428564 RepID=A0A8D8QYV1_9HEMI